MLIYIIIFFLVSIKIKNGWYYFIILLFFSALRDGIGYDFAWYYKLAGFYDMKNVPIFLHGKNIIEKFSEQIDVLAYEYYRIEILNRIFYKLIWFFRFPQQSIGIIYAFLTMLFIKLGLDKYKSNSNSWLLFYSFPLFYLSFFSILRQGLAVSIVFFSYHYIMNKQYIKFLFFILFAGLIHGSAFFMLSILILEKLKIKKILYVYGIFIISIFKDFFKYVVVNTNLPVISKYKYYIIVESEKSGTKIYYLVFFIYVLILIFIYFKKNFYKNNDLLIKLSMTGSFLYCSLIEFPAIGIRVSIYFLIFLLYLISCIKVKPRIIFVIICFIILIARLLLSNEFVPYRTILLKS